MRKDKLIIAVVMLVLVTLIVPGAFAAVDNQTNQSGGTIFNSDEKYSNQTSDRQLQQLDQAGNNGQITPEQSQTWQEHLNYMRNFHNQYGMGTWSGCYGYSMMGGYGGYQAPNFRQQ